MSPGRRNLFKNKTTYLAGGHSEGGFPNPSSFDPALRILELFLFETVYKNEKGVAGQMVYCG